MLVDVGVSVLCSSAPDSVCLWTIDSWVYLDVGLDTDSRRSYSSGKHDENHQQFKWTAYIVCSFRSALTGPSLVLKHMFLYLITVLMFSQIQWTHIGASIHSRTPFTYRLPKDEWHLVVTLNLLYAAVPVLLAARCYTDQTFFMKSAPQVQASNGKKMK